MITARAIRRCGSALRYLLGAALSLLTVGLALTGSPWHVCAVMFSVALIICYGRDRRIFRADVRRTGDRIICRFIPSYEGSTYFSGMVLPIFGIGTIAGGNASHSLYLVVAGTFIVCLSALMLALSIFMWRRNLFTMTPSIVTVRAFVIGVGANERALTEIRRDLVVSVGLVWNRDTFGSQVEIVHLHGQEGATTKTVIRTRQLSVHPEHLHECLVAWMDATDRHATDLMDEVERILRRRTLEKPC